MVVNEDINIYDTVEIECAIATRVGPKRDIIILPSGEAVPEAIRERHNNVHV